MADICTNTRRSHWKEVRKGPQLGLWMWYIVINVISLPCIFSSCHGVNISVSLYPAGQLNLRYGEPLEMYCVAEQYTADDIEFFLGGEHVDSEVVNRTTRRLYKENLKRQVIPYYCKNKITKKHCTSRVLIDGPPSNVTDFSCISRNLEELNCTWSKAGHLSIIDYTLRPFLNDVPSLACPLTRQGENWLCSLNTSSTPRYQQMDEIYKFRLKGCNIFGCNEQDIVIVHNSIVKPDPPEKLTVVSEEPHAVTLKWSIPITMGLLECPIIHRIEYQIAKIDNTSYFRSVNTSDLKSTSDIYSIKTLNRDFNKRHYTYTLKNLPYAHRSYEVRIYIRPELATEDRYWSDFSFKMFTTASERPQRPPVTTVGAFFQSLYDNYRRIYVYWKQLEEYEEAGANFTYKVIVKQGSRSPYTIFSDKNKSLSYVILNAAYDAIDISIWSTNTIGSSENSSHLYIPAKQDTEVLKVLSFTKLAYENGTYKLSWVHMDNIDNYTLFWCHHNVSEVCNDRMNFTVLEPTNNYYVINLPREYRYQFAIAANKGYKTSGMIWAACDISKDTIPMYGIPVKLNHDAAGKTHVRINWTLDCSLQPGIITGYQISYGPTVNLTSDVLTKNITIDNPHQMAKNITDLMPYTTYQFILAINTTYGLKTIKNASTGVTTTEDTPTSPRNVTISDIQSNSLNVSWEPPLHENGVIGSYVILDNNRQIHVEKITEKEKNVTRRPVRVTGLKPFTNYTIRVVACNTGINSCSLPSPKEGIFVRTRIGVPSTLKAPSVKTNPARLKWEPPALPGGTVDRYDIRRVKDDTTNETFNTTELTFYINPCDGVETAEYYQIRAVNLDQDPYHGILVDNVDIVIPEAITKQLEFYGEWSDPSTINCNNRDGITMTLILLAVFALIGILYGSIKLFKVVRKMEDIDPVLPSGLGIPEKDISKYPFSGLYSTNKEQDKPSSDEVLLLPSRTSVSTPDNKENADNNCGSSDHTDSTALSDTSRGPIKRHASTSDDGSDSSLHLEVETVRIDDNNASHDEEDSSNSETDNSRESTPDFSNKGFKKNPSGYVQSIIKPTSGYVQSAPAPLQNPLAKPAAQPASSSYVMAALSPPIFTTGVAPPNIQTRPPASSAYVRPEDVQARSMMNFPKLGPSPTKVFGSESLPTMPILPQPVKHGADSSYIQLQSLDALTSHNKPVRSVVPLQPPVSSGYVSPGDAVINKHLNNMLSGGQLAEEPAILDPTMSPDAYCRFSWSTDPANDNLHSLLADSHTLKSSKN